eukprot:CAMPEP_0182884136 /NCGR_PEP_ID=MMETSP0034_2-20130328/18803_1 /TAXON_ID=156128 /ORGANISM="Nephroselmis pyriformis, Strain CCMP717" /LENGTH=702 /DNA_ID=CAMNT_0025017309 /DNA_START=48 /DNA_END=2152 /DNA_ORIENTATION=+
MSEDKKKKKIRPGALELAEDESALVVHYTVEEDGAVEEKQKRIKVKVRPDSKLQKLAEEIVDKCKFIPGSKLMVVEDLLQQLQVRQAGMASSRDEEAEMDNLKERRNSVMEQSQMAQGSKGGHQWSPEDAELESMDGYLEMLYEDSMEDKIKATFYISCLSRRTEYLEALLSHGTVFGALSRTLKEDGKKSIDLCINIMSVFFSLSNFSLFHQVILENQIGNMAMTLIDLEIKRSELRANEDESYTKVPKRSAAGEELSEKQQRVMNVIRKQDRLLYVCFYMLLNLSEDVSVERKMKKKNVTVYLVKMLERNNVELLILCVTFLKKLSIYKENKEKMSECGIVDKLAQFVPVRHDVLLISVLRLLHNLSFDSGMRDDMVRNGLIPKCVELMRLPQYQQVVMALLYHISIDDKYKSMFTYTDAVPMILEMLLNVEDLRSAPELIALAVNLTQNARNAEVMCEGDGLHLLVQRAMHMSDELCFKVVRNLSQQDLEIKRKFKPYILPMVRIIRAEDTSSDLLVEVMGCIGNLNIPEFDFLKLVREHQLLDFLAMHLQPGVVEDDIMLEVVIMVGTLCTADTAREIVDAGLVTKLYHLMSEKKEDDEFVLQITYAFHRLLLHEASQLALLENTKVVYYLVDLLQDKNKQVRVTADAALDVIMDAHEDWAVKIRRMKFESHNQEWLEVIDADDAEVHEHQERMMGMR